MKSRSLGIFCILVFGVIFAALRVNAQTTSYCQHCQKEVTWLPLSQDSAEGHFYVTENRTIPQLTFQGTACLDLRGHTLETEGTRAFYLTKQAVVSLQDSVGGGKVIGSLGSDTTSGGTVYIYAGSTFNLYGGTLTNIPWEGKTVRNGGVVHCAGTFRMYGGSVENGTAGWIGGNVNIDAGGIMTMYGGSITGGTAPTAHTGCVLVRGGLTLSGDAYLEKARLWPKNDNPPVCDILTIDGLFTGYASLYVDGTRENLDMGNVTNGGSFGPDNINLLGSELELTVSGTDIVLRSVAAAIYGEAGFETYTVTLAQAAALSQGTNKTILLRRDNEESVTAAGDLNVDLNGYSWAALTMEENATLFLKDSATDDFKGVYGKIASLSGSVNAVDGYKLYTEETGVSAHAFAMQTTEAALRPATAGMYFIGKFKGDEALKSLVYSYGLILDVFTEPSHHTLNNTSVHTTIRDGFEDNNGVNSIPLTGVLKELNSRGTNLRNAELSVYCRPFIRFTDGSFAWGETRKLSFRELVEKVDKKWTEEAVPGDLQEMYLRFSDVMADWDIPNLKRAVETSAPSPYRVPTPMTMETIDSLPIATADMTPKELRQLCADFFRMQLTFQWVSETDIGYDVRGRHVLLPAGTVYGGSPYSARAKSGNLYMTMEFYDQKTGVLCNPGGMTDHDFVWLFGNHCTYGPFWAWERVINSVTTQWNVNMGLEKYGYIPLGAFSTASIEEWTVGVADTKIIGQAVGEQAVFEGYAQTRLADCLYTWYGDAISHMRMVSQAPVVVRNNDGTINPEESYIIYMDQGGTWRQRNINGDLITVQGGLDDKVTFRELFDGGYLAFTFKEFHGLDPVEKGEVTSTLDGLTTITPKMLAKAAVKANYAISHVTISVTDGDQEVYRQNAFSPRINTLEMGISDAVDEERLTALTGKTLTVTCRIGTGEKVVLFSGTIQ